MNKTIALANPLPEFPAVNVELNDQLTILTYRPQRWARLFAYGFFGIWLSGWSLMCLVMLGGLLADFSWFGLMVCLPFFVGWFFGAGMLLYSVTGKQVIRIGPDSVEVTNSILLGKTLDKRVKLQDVLQIRTTLDDGTYSCLFETSSGAIPLYISSSNEQHIEKAVEFLKSQLGSFRTDQPVLESLTNLEATGEIQFNEIKTGTSAFQLRRTSQRPDECRWNNEPGFAGKTVFSQTGKFNFLQTLTMTGVCLFWNSITMIFVLAPHTDFGNQVNRLEGAGLILLYVFMTPFVIIGLVLTGVVLKNILASFFKTTFAFSNSEIIRTKHYFGISFSQSWLATESLQIVLKHKQEDRDKQLFQPDGQDKEPRQFSLEFHSAEEKVTDLSDLTYDEASWMGTVLVDHLRNFHNADLG